MSERELTNKMIFAFCLIGIDWITLFQQLTNLSSSCMRLGYITLYYETWLLFDQPYSSHHAKHDVFWCQSWKSISNGIHVLISLKRSQASIYIHVYRCLLSQKVPLSCQMMSVTYWASFSLGNHLRQFVFNQSQDCEGVKTHTPSIVWQISFFASN